MPHGLVPLAVIAGGFVVQFVIQLTTTSRYDYRCGNCGETFSPSPLALAVAFHRTGGYKYARCARCGVRSWAERVPKS